MTTNQLTKREQVALALVQAYITQDSDSYFDQLHLDAIFENADKFLKAAKETQNAK